MFKDFPGWLLLINKTQMATPTPNKSSSSDESPEYTTMRENYDKLVDLLSPSIASLTRTLFARNLIPKAVMNKLRTSSTPEADKTADLLSYLMSRIELEQSVFHNFMKALEEHDPSVAEMVTTSYKSHTFVSDVSSLSLKSSESQSKLRLEFTVPQDIPQEVFTVLESVQVSVLVEDQVSVVLCSAVTMF